MKKFIPSWLIKWYRQRELSKLKKKSKKEIFTEIYEKNFWKSQDSISGPGSVEDQTRVLIRELDSLFDKLEVNSLLDIPCGDFNWMKRVNLKNIQYTGGDIVEDLIERNNAEYKKNNIRFEVLDLQSDPLPKTDIVLIRDCFVHFSFENIKISIKNLKASGSKYILTTTFPEHYDNPDIITGDWRPVNLEAPPFNFPIPKIIINENCTEANGIYKDKSLALWSINDIPVPETQSF